MSLNLLFISVPLWHGSPNVPALSQVSQVPRLVSLTGVCYVRLFIRQGAKFL